MEEYLASSHELNDADKRAFLYSDLSIQKTENPESFIEALGFWKYFLIDASFKGLVTAKTNTSRLCVDRKQLGTLLSYKGDTPMGLDMVVDELLQRGDLQPIEEYFAPVARRLVGWLVYQVPLINRQLRSLVFGSSGANGRLVVRSMVEKTGQWILNSHYEQVTCSLMDNLMDMDEFRSKFASVFDPQPENAAAVSPLQQDQKDKGAKMAIVDANILVKHLSDQGHLTTMHLDSPYMTETRTLIKFAASIRTRVQPITEADTGAYQVSWTQKQLSRQISQLETRVSILDTQIRQAIKTPSGKNLALSRLRMKRHIEMDVLPKRIDALHNLERVYLRLEQTSSEIQLMEAFEAGTRALRGLNDSVQVDRISRVFDDWAEESLRSSELDDAMADGRAGVHQAAVGLSSEETDEELEAELETMLEEERKRGLKELASNAASHSNANAEPETRPESEDAGKLADILQQISLSSPNANAQPTAKDDTEKDHREERDKLEKVAVPAE
ncbi:hypothetical protein LPJ64_002060 [Coemansia asiatica]|uniref:Uncharacterized protein n=1 Tax=Coemansia asiatica TaxID=1052880 RepID=A0A9W7XNT8_9FUNG|nr:hypothetical protein LPJ64_002060 [Coemansia asiatica]